MPIVATRASRDALRRRPTAARRVVEQAAGRLGDQAAAPALIKAALQELGR